jgi:PqqD family protein of HPr-rel-A system
MAGPLYIADPDPLAGAVELEGLLAVFHAPSGTSHILAPPAPQILESLAGRAGGVEEILERVSERFDVDSEDASEALAARLAELEAAGLVWRV